MSENSSLNICSMWREEIDPINGIHQQVEKSVCLFFPFFFFSPKECEGLHFCVVSFFMSIIIILLLLSGTHN